MIEPLDSLEESDSSENESSGFDKLGLSAVTLRGVHAAGYENPTPVQARAIPIMLSGRDLVAQAQTGTGKTAAFALPIIEKLDPAQGYPQALVVCPTRELAVQVSEACYALGRSRSIRCLAVYGGQPIDRQLRSLRSGVHIVVGTPGRLLDHIRRKTLDLSRVSTIILDEADEMLAMGFVEDIELILDELPQERQIALFSATMPAPIVALSRRYLRDPQSVNISEGKPSDLMIRQSYYEVSPAHKMDALARILDMETPGPTIIFCRTRRDADEVGEHLRGRGYGADTLHGEMTQAERDRVMKRFRAGQADLLVATDVAARGLDIDTVTHVVNYDIPWDVESYTHRIGRTGRAGREGDAITLVSPRERRQLKLIEKMTGARIKPVRLPTSADIAKRRRELFKQAVLTELAAGEFEQYLMMVEELADEHEASDVAAAALKLLWQQQKNQMAVEEVDNSDGARPEEGMARLFLSIGRQQGLRPTDLVGAIANEANLRGQDIGTIDILDSCAFVEVPSHAAERVVQALARTTLRGQSVRVEVAAPGDRASSQDRSARHSQSSNREDSGGSYSRPRRGGPPAGAQRGRPFPKKRP